MKIFIDIGGGDSFSARYYRKRFDKESKNHIYTFEPKKQYKRRYQNIANHTLIQKAAWTGDSTGTIDITAFITESFSRTDTVDVKMNIGGDEYYLIPDMVKRGAFRIIRKFHIVWHQDKIDKETHLEVFDMIPVHKLSWPNG